MTVVTDIDSLMQHARERTLTVQGIPEEVSWLTLFILVGFPLHVNTIIWDCPFLY